MGKPSISLADFTDLLDGHQRGEEVIEVPLSAIAGSGPVQTRRSFDPQAYEADRELVESVKEHGVLQPVVLAPVGDETARQYRIIFGHRRTAACSHAGRDTVPAIVRTMSEIQAAEYGIIENLQREGLNPLEEARQYETYIQVAGVGVDEVATRVNVSRRKVYYFLQLLELPDVLQSAIEENTLNPTQARACAEAPEDKLAAVVEAVGQHDLPAIGIERLLVSMTESPGVPVELLARDVTGQRASASSRKQGGAARKSTETQKEKTAMDYRPYTTILSTDTRRETLETLARDMQLDEIAVRRAALLLCHDTRLAVPSAVAYAQQLAETDVGRALQRIEVGVERMRLAVQDNLTPSQTKSAVLVLRHVKTWADEVIGLLEGRPPAVVAGVPAGDNGRGHSAR